MRGSLKHARPASEQRAYSGLGSPSEVSHNLTASRRLGATLAQLGPGVLAGWSLHRASGVTWHPDGPVNGRIRIKWLSFENPVYEIDVVGVLSG